MKALQAIGLTLVEVLVALLVLALMTLMSHQAISVLLLSQSSSDRHGQNLASLQIGLAQWRRDLDRLDRTPYVNALQWDGRVLRLLRRSGSGDALLVVAWTVQDGWWRRWQSPPLRDRALLLQAWLQSTSAVLARPASAQGSPHSGSPPTDLLRLERWELSFEPQSPMSASEGDRSETRLQDLPQVVRLRLIGIEGAGLSAPLQINSLL